MNFLIVALFVVSLAILIVTLLGVLADYHLEDSPYDGSQGDLANLKVRLGIWLLVIHIPFILTNNQMLGLALLTFAAVTETSLFVFYRRKLFGGG